MTARAPEPDPIVSPASVALTEYMADRDISARTAGHALNASHWSVWAWCNGFRFPTPPMRDRIERWTEGEVRADMWPKAQHNTPHKVGNDVTRRPAMARVLRLPIVAGRGFERGNGERRDSCYAYLHCLNEWVSAFAQRGDGAGRCPKGCAHFKEVDRAAESRHNAMARRYVESN